MSSQKQVQRYREKIAALRDENEHLKKRIKEMEPFMIFRDCIRERQGFSYTFGKQVVL